MGENIAALTTQIYLIRHGESEWNRLSRYTGQQDAALSGLGKKQAYRLAERLEREGLAAIYTSPLRRARDTASAINRLARVPVILDAGLMEINHGLWEGLDVDQVCERFPREYAQWRMQPHTVVMPQGESLADVTERAATVLRRILAEQRGSKVAVCSHDAVLRVLLLTALGLPLEHFWKWDFENASLSMIQARGNGTVDFRLVRLNDIAHLAGVYSEYALQAL